MVNTPPCCNVTHIQYKISNHSSEASPLFNSLPWQSSRVVWLVAIFIYTPMVSPQVLFRLILRVMPSNYVLFRSGCCKNVRIIVTRYQILVTTMVQLYIFVFSGCVVRQVTVGPSSSFISNVIRSTSLSWTWSILLTWLSCLLYCDAEPEYITILHTHMMITWFSEGCSRWHH